MKLKTVSDLMFAGNKIPFVKEKTKMKSLMISTFYGDSCSRIGAVEGSRTPTSKWTLDPEPSASTNSATTAFGGI